MSSLSKLHALIQSPIDLDPHVFYPEHYLQKIEHLSKDIAEKVDNVYKPYLEETIVAQKGLSLEDNLQLQYYFNSINFCYWSAHGEEKWNVENADGKTVDGSEAMLMALEKAQIHTLSGAQIRSLSVEDFSTMIGGSGKLLLLSERLEILQQASTLLDEYGDKYKNLVMHSEKSALSLLETLAASPAFMDNTKVQSDSIPFLKRAQLLAKVTQDLLPDEEKLDSLDDFTAFSDYKVPQVLEKLDLLRYSPELREKLDKEVFIAKDSDEEAAIRLMTIFIVEDLKKSLNRLGITLNAPQIDSLLWNLSNLPPYSAIKKNYHRTVTTAY